MKVKEAKNGSIYYRFLRALLVAFFTASIFFLLLNRAGNVLLQSYFDKSNYMKMENDRRMDSFKKYVAENHVSLSNIDDVHKWVTQQSIVWMQIYRDEILIYDSQYPFMKANPKYHVEERFYKWDPSHRVEFQDGNAEVFLTGMYTYQFFNYALVAEIFLSFILFTALIMMEIHGMLSYIRLLGSEIQILETGNLNYPVTVRGNDELAILADGLNSLRKSIRAQFRQEAELIQLNQSMISSLSHDLRTPLSALFLYGEILKQELQPEQKQALKCADKINEKAGQIKNMADRILEYSMQKQVSPGTAKPSPFRAAFYDLLSETSLYLENQGFQIRSELNWKEDEVLVEPDYLLRILDNICSNVIKYAAKESPVRIACFYEDSHCGFLVENRKKKRPGTVESTHIGVSNICSMMEEMGGLCKVEETKDQYRILIRFLKCGI